jgi:hypothetical protein
LNDFSSEIIEVQKKVVKNFSNAEREIVNHRLYIQWSYHSEMMRERKTFPDEENFRVFDTSRPTLKED